MKDSGYSSEDGNKSNIELEESELSFLNIFKSEAKKESRPVIQCENSNFNSIEKCSPNQASVPSRTVYASTCGDLNFKTEPFNIRCQSSSQLKPSRFELLSIKNSKLEESISSNQLNLYNKGGYPCSNDVHISSARINSNLSHHPKVNFDSSVSYCTAQPQYYAFIPASLSAPQNGPGLIYNIPLSAQIASPSIPIISNSNYYFPSYQIGYPHLVLFGNQNANHIDATNTDFIQSHLNKNVRFGKVNKEPQMHVSTNDSKKHQQKVSDILEKDNISEYINSLKGSKKVQKIISPLEDQHPQILLLFEHILPSLGKITNHNFGNYLCKLLLKKVGFNERQQAWKFYKRRNLLDYALHQFGNHSIQSLINSATSLKEEMYVIDQLEEYFDILAFHHNGVHILESILSNYDERSIEVLISYLKQNFLKLSSHLIGSALAKNLARILASNKPNVKSDFLKLVYNQLSALLNNRYGYSVIIELIDSWGTQGSSLIAEVLAQRIICYLRGKYSQHVIFKCLDTVPKVSLILFNFYSFLRKFWVQSTYWWNSQSLAFSLKSLKDLLRDLRLAS